MAGFGITDTICRDASNLLLKRDLPQKVRQNGRISDTVTGHLDGSQFQRFSIDADVDFVTLPAAAGSMFTNLPLLLPKT